MWQEAMDSAETGKLIDSLSLTLREERTLRHLAGLDKPKPRGRIDKFLQRPLKGAVGTLLVVAVLIGAASLAYVAWSHRVFFEEDQRLLGYISAVMPLFILLIFFVELVVCRRLARKLYKSLEKERSSIR
jgi:hypothetical protein